MKYEVGQVLWFQPRERNLVPGELKVTAVGRKWAQLDGGRYRVALNSTSVDCGDYTSPATLYASKEAYEQHLLLVRAWTNLRRAIERPWYPPEHITLEAIQAAATALGLTLEDK